MPEEQDATDEYRLRSLQICSADIFRQDFRADGGADHEALLVRRPLLAVPGENSGVGRHHAVAAARPYHRDPPDELGAPGPVPRERGSERLIGQDAREVIDAAIP